MSYDTTNVSCRQLLIGASLGSSPLQALVVTGEKLEGWKTAIKKAKQKVARMRGPPSFYETTGTNRVNPNQNPNQNHRPMKVLGLHGRNPLRQAAHPLPAQFTVERIRISMLERCP